MDTIYNKNTLCLNNNWRLNAIGGFEEARESSRQTAPADEYNAIYKCIIQKCCGAQNS